MKKNNNSQLQKQSQRDYQFVMLEGFCTFAGAERADVGSVGMKGSLGYRKPIFIMLKALFSIFYGDFPGIVYRVFHGIDVSQLV
jgi:hypothetical protein